MTISYNYFCNKIDLPLFIGSVQILFFEENREYLGRMPVGNIVLVFQPTLSRLSFNREINLLLDLNRNANVRMLVCSTELGEGR